MEDNDLVDPVDEFGPEMGSDLEHDRLANLIKIGLGG